MYKSHKILFLAITIVSYAGACYFLVSPIEGLNGFLVSYFSISFAFCTFGLSTLFGSRLSNSFFSEIDPQKPTQRRLHTIKHYYRFVFLINSLGLLGVLVNLIISSQSMTICIWGYRLSRYTALLPLPLFFLSLHSTYLIFKIILHGVEREAKL